MQELQLKIVKNAEDNVFGRAMNNLNKVIYSSGSGFYNIVINMKRNTLLKNFLNFEDYSKIADEDKREGVLNKYNKAYENYLGTLEKYIEETIYTRVQKKVGTLKENHIMSEYYEIMSLRGLEYVEYKCKRQMMLLNMDWDNVMTSKNNNTVEKYKKFYVVTMERLYKSAMRHYSILLTDNSNNNDKKYEKIYELIESYIKLVLPYVDETEENKCIIEEYTKYIMTIDTYSKKTYNEIKKNMLLLELSRSLFLYSLPMIAAEQCYVKLIKDARQAISNSFIEVDKYELYKLLLDLIESYNVNVLSKKVYWDNPVQREDYNKFWGKFKELKKLERIDFDEYIRNREILFITYDLKMLAKSKKKHEEIKKYYRERMIVIHGFRKLKNKLAPITGIWYTRRRVKQEGNNDDRS